MEAVIKPMLLEIHKHPVNLASMLKDGRLFSVKALDLETFQAIHTCDRALAFQAVMDMFYERWDRSINSKKDQGQVTWIRTWND